ncbi:MAG: type II toxin-antitoxin system RelE/ParE family toxin [Brevundimonas sp.]|nr:MAG: type II toxin-antitoxin system RelE/ParE family toxin [Brevundimonas sp.]
MVEIIQTDAFQAWLSALRDRRAATRILVRIARLADGNPGDVKPVGEGLSEMRIDHGPGYRVYFTRRGGVLIIVLCGGDKATQDKDIRQAKTLAQAWKD